MIEQSQWQTLKQTAGDEDCVVKCAIKQVDMSAGSVDEVSIDRRPILDILHRDIWLRLAEAEAILYNLGCALDSGYAKFLFHPQCSGIPADGMGNAANYVEEIARQADRLLNNLRA